MPTILITTWEGGSNIVTMVELARQLVEAGHRIILMSDKCNAADVAGSGAEFRPWRHAPSRPTKAKETAYFTDWLVSPGEEATRLVCSTIVTGPATGYARDVLEVVDTEDVAAVVSHDYLLGVMAAAESRRIPCFLFTATIWMLPTVETLPTARLGLLPSDKEVDQIEYRRLNRDARSIFNTGLAKFNDLRRRLGLDPLGDVLDQINYCSKVMLGTCEQFDFDSDHFGDKFEYVGPYIGNPAGNITDIELPTGDAPLVLAGLSTMYQAQEVVLRNIIDAMAQLPVRGVITLGPSLESPNILPSNVRVVAAASHQDILKTTSVMVTHAGHGSTLRALSAGVPLLCMPKGRDQFAVAARAAHCGAAIVRDALADADVIAAGISELLGDIRYRAAARKISGHIRRDLEERRGGSVIERLLRGKDRVAQPISASM